MNEDYSQPSFYHFTEDSVKLAKWAARCSPNASSLVDICAGCGVVGIEIARLIPVNRIEFVELQDDFELHIKDNISKFLSPEIECNTFIGQVSRWIPKQKFDLIVLNPPYFVPGKGKPSQNLKRHLTRCLSVDDWDNLIHKIKVSMHSWSHAYIVLRKNDFLTGIIEKTCSKWKLQSVAKFEKELVFLDIFTLDENGNQDSL